ncbi:hypothetical protein D3C79_926780 [compost metagenome]
MQVIALNPGLKQKYDEIKAINSSLASMQLDTPSANFTANVMAQFRTEMGKPEALKTLVNRKIIYGIAAVFSAIIIGLLFFTIWNAPAEPSAQFMATSNQVQQAVDSQVDSLLNNKVFWRSFLMIDAVLLLIFADKLLSRRSLKNIA